MTERVPEGAASPAGGGEQPVPKDPPDQQIQEGEDPLDVPVPQRVREHADGSGDDASQDVPDTDESGAGRVDAEPSEAESRHLSPDESTG